MLPASSPPSLQSPLGKLLDVAELLGCRSLAATVDCRLTAVLLQDGLADTAGAGSLATKHRCESCCSEVAGDA